MLECGFESWLRLEFSGFSMYFSDLANCLFISWNFLRFLKSVCLVCIMKTEICLDSFLRGKVTFLIVWSLALFVILLFF